MFLTRGDISAYLCEASGTQVQIYHLTFLSQAICKFRPFVEATQKLSWRAKHHDHAKDEAVEGRYGTGAGGRTWATRRWGLARALGIPTFQAKRSGRNRHRSWTVASSLTCGEAGLDKGWQRRTCPVRSELRIPW
jgi:hypothetical protein